MYGHNEYISLKTGTRRAPSRRLLYLVLGILMGVALTMLVVNKWRSGNTHQKTAEPHRHRGQQHHGQQMKDVGSSPSSSFGASQDKHERHADQHKGNGKATFHATNEWQDIPPGAVLPAGLDVQLDFQTGKRKARLHQEGAATDDHLLPVVQEAAQPLEPGHSHAAPRPAGQSATKTLIEERLEQLSSADPAIRDSALAWLDVEAHRIHIGEAITHAQNFKNLFHLMGTGAEQMRLDAGSIIAACLHNNPGAVEGALMTPLVARLTERLPVETSSKVQRRMVAILTYLAEANLPSTLYQFVAAHGFEALDKINVAEISPALLEREIVLLATLAREESDARNTPALVMLDRYLPRVKASLNDVTLDVLRPVCTVEDKFHPPRFANLAAFCKAHPAQQ